MSKKIDIEAHSSTVKCGNTSIKNNSDNKVTNNNNLTLSLVPSIPGTSASSQAAVGFQDLWKTLNRNSDNANAGSSVAVDDRIELNVQDCIESFTGRTTLLKKLHQIIEANRNSSKLTVISQTSVISGMGGVGKTETARKYIHEYKAHYHNIIWIGAETVPEIQTSFRQLATKLGLVLPNGGSETANLFNFDEVYSALCKNSTLIVFDNAERLDDEGKEAGIRSYLPPSIKHGWTPPAILVTSRNRKWNPVDKKSVIELSGLDDEECIELLLTQLNISDTEKHQKTATQIKILCEGLPLAVQQVIAFIKQENETSEVLGRPTFTMEDFIRSYEERKAELLKMRPDESPAGKSVFVIFQLTFAKIAANKKTGVLAMKCLRMMCYLTPDNIPKKLFPHILDDDKNASNVAESLKLLEQYNLINNFGDIFKIHRMIQEVALGTKRLWVGMKEVTFPDVLISELLPLFTNFLNQFHSDSSNVYDILRCAAHFLLNLPKDLLSLLPCKLFYSKLDQRLADNYMNELLVLVRKAMIEGAGSAFELVELKHRLAASFGANGSYNDALTLFQEILPLLSQQYGPDSDRVLEVHGQMAIVLLNQGKLSEALDMRKSIEENRMRVLGNTHQKTIAARADVANVLLRQREYKEAFTLLNELVSVSISALGPDDQVTLQIERLLAENFQGLGKYEESTSIFSRVIPKLEKQFGCGHIEVWSVKYDLGVSYLIIGRINEAYEIISEYVKVLPQFFSGNHPNITRAKIMLANALAQMGKFEQAMQIVRDTQPIVNASLATDIGGFSGFYENVGGMFKNAGNFHEAENLYRHAITRMEEFFPSDHPEILHFKSLLRLLHEHMSRIGSS